MPNSKTFKIKAIKDLILKYATGLIIDPFANECSIKSAFRGCEYVSNDLDTDFDTDFHLDAKDFMEHFDDGSVDVVLFDPPYSSRQVSECYKKLGKTVTMKDTSSGWFTPFKEQIARVLRPGGVCIYCGWNTNGVGKKYGLEIVEILMVAHGGMHNDTLVTVERKV